MTQQFSSATEQQSTMVEKINRNVTSIGVTKPLSRQADETARVSQALNQVANHQQIDDPFPCPTPSGS